MAAFFPILAAVLVLLIVTGQWALDGETSGLFLLVSGFIPLSAGFLMLTRRGARSVERMTNGTLLVLFSFIAAGCSLWVAAPFVMAGGGVGWEQVVGSGRYRIPLWALAASTIVIAGLAAWGIVTTARRCITVRAVGVGVDHEEHRKHS